MKAGMSAYRNGDGPRCLRMALALLGAVLAGSFDVAAQDAPAKPEAGRFVSQKLVFPDASPAQAGKVLVETVLPDTLPGVTTTSVALVGPAQWNQSQQPGENFVLLFLDGQGSLSANDQTFAIDGETIARAPMGWSLEVRVPAGERLCFLAIRKEITAVDLEDLARYPDNNAAPWVRKFSECEPYREAIKSPKTISRTLLAANHVPRVALGTVETTGPDKVGEHKHPMLEQLFLGLRGNEITVRADGAEAALGEFHLLLIPHASMHGAVVADGKKLHYIWMDFFSDKEGQAWLETHQAIPPGETPAPQRER